MDFNGKMNRMKYYLKDTRIANLPLNGGVVIKEKKADSISQTISI